MQFGGERPTARCGWRSARGPARATRTPRSSWTRPSAWTPTSTTSACGPTAPFAGGAFARVSVHHDVCTDVLRSDAFGQIGGNRTDGLPPVLKLALRLAGPRQSVGPIDPPSMLAVDPPEHTRYRRLVSRAFSARAVARLRERTVEIAGELLDGLEREAGAGGPVDLVARYASLLPVTVISEMLGVPVGMREQFLAWGDAATPSLDIGVDWATHRSVERNLAELDAWFRGHLRDLRRAPGDDLLSAAGHRGRRRRRAAHRAGAAGHRRPGLRGRVRDHGQPDRQRRRACSSRTPTSAGGSPRTRRCGPTRSTRSCGSTRRCSARDGGPRATPPCTACPSRRASWC